MEYAKPCMSMRLGNARYSADSDVATIGSQITRFGITPVGHLGGCFVDQVRRIFLLWDAHGGAGMPEERALAGSG